MTPEEKAIYLLKRMYADTHEQCVNDAIVLAEEMIEELSLNNDESNHRLKYWEETLNELERLL